MAAGGNGHLHLFVGGLHKSGTTIVARALDEHPEISGLAGTGVPEDEGQHLQSVVPIARAHGGPGRFALDSAAHLTEESPLATAANGRRMFDSWSPHWDLSRPVLVEKSPPNVIRARFLQALFPRSVFAMVVRHPVAVALATSRWTNVGLESLLRHWVRAHETLASDLPHVRRCEVVLYERFVADPAAALAPVLAALGREPFAPSLEVRADGNSAYFARWRHSLNPVWARRRRALEEQFEPLVRPFGYSLLDLALVPQRDAGRLSRRPA